jgi:hypothetical protein
MRGEDLVAQQSQCESAMRTLVAGRPGAGPPKWARAWSARGRLWPPGSAPVGLASKRPGNLLARANHLGSTAMKTDPVQIYLHGNSFCEAYKMLSRTSNDPALMMSVGTPVMVMSAFSSELFLKCLICLETGKSSYGHHLKELFDQLSVPIKESIEQLWDQTVVPLRKPLWLAAEEQKVPIPRDLRSALAAGNDAFQTMRYCYEPDQAKKICFVLTDLPLVLKTVILQIKPEWRHVGRHFHPVGDHAA